jgi:hypothetical protein
MELKPLIRYYYETPRKSSKKKVGIKRSTKLLRKLEDLRVGRRTVKEINGPLTTMSLSAFNPALLLSMTFISG